MFEECTKNMQHVTIPTYSETIDELNAYIDLLEKRKNQTVTNSNIN